jgi:hypothetical protein
MQDEERPRAGPLKSDSDPARSVATFARCAECRRRQIQLKCLRQTLCHRVIKRQMTPRRVSPPVYPTPSLLRSAG